MEVNKADLLKNIQNFIGAENDLAVKEAQHQIGIFKAVYEQEIEAYELEEKENALNPAEEDLNVAILEAIASFEKNEAKKKMEKEKGEKANLKLKDLCGVEEHKNMKPKFHLEKFMN